MAPSFQLGRTGQGAPIRSTVMNSRQLEKILPVVGATVLLLSWAVQQLMFNEWNATLSRIGSTEAAFQSYRAANEVFKALEAIAPENLKATVQMQQYDGYRKGLQELAKALETDAYDRIRAADITAMPEGADFETSKVNFKIMIESNAMQRALEQERKALTSKKNAAEALFRWLYALGTLLAIAGGIARLTAARSESGPK